MIQIQKQSQLNLNDLKLIKKQFKDLIQEINMYVDNGDIVYSILLDSSKGGSGEIHNWDKSAEIVSSIKPFPVMLAGGLNPDNIKNAISKVKPYGVDVMSGVSNKTREKNSEKVSSFINNIDN